MVVFWDLVTKWMVSEGGQDTAVLSKLKQDLAPEYVGGWRWRGGNQLTRMTLGDMGGAVH